jgi:hypothetical protein
VCIRDISSIMQLKSSYRGSLHTEHWRCSIHWLTS